MGLSVMERPDSSARRADGVRITHDPFGEGMAEKYGRPGQTDSEGFDPYQDTVGPGIYGGIVQRNPDTEDVLVGKQYQNHNPRPGPMYAGGGYTPITRALQQSGLSQLTRLLDKWPTLVNEETTGGAQPLHMCGMGKMSQDKVALLVSRGADLEALDTYGMTPLHRMASNNLAVAATQLLERGADPNNKGQINSSPMEIAQASDAQDVMRVLEKFSQTPARPLEQPHSVSVIVDGPTDSAVIGEYDPQPPEMIPLGFAKVCEQNGWSPDKTWKKLNADKTWWKRVEEEEGTTQAAFIYFNEMDRKWWIDGADGLGRYKSKQSLAYSKNYPPHAHGWERIEASAKHGLPILRIKREQPGNANSDL